MHTLNLSDFIDIKKHGNSSEFENFKSLKLRNIKDKEVEDLEKLYNCLSVHIGYEFLSGFIFGETCSRGIREEFDLLRFSKSSIINIELKNKLTDKNFEKTENQAKRHKLLLSQSGFEVKVFTFIASTNSFYTVDINNDFRETTVNELIEHLSSPYITQNLLNNIDINKLVISPTQNLKSSRIINTF